MTLLLAWHRADPQQAEGYKPLKVNFKIVQRQSSFKIFIEVFFSHSLFHYLSLLFKFDMKGCIGGLLLLLPGLAK